jgi:hypothetical protein
MLERFVPLLALVFGCVVGEDLEPGVPPFDDLAEEDSDPAGLVIAAAGGMPDELCDAAHPVRLTIGMYGHDNNSVHATVGIDLADNSQSVDREGKPDLNKVSYPLVLNYNTTYDYEGKPKGTPGEVRSWTGCVGANVTRVYIEAYPRDVTGKTNRTKYGSTVYQYIAVNGPGTYKVDMRFPVVSEWAAARGRYGDTGNIFGHVMCNGVPAVPDHRRLRVWSTQPGSACGIRSYSASAELTDTTSPTYKFTAIAGGQCNGPSQPAAVYVRGNCNGKYREVKKIVDVTTGKTLPLNIELSGGIDRGAPRTY